MIEWTAPPRRPLLRQPAAVASLLWLIAIVIGTTLAPVLAPGGPQHTDTVRALLPPGQGGWLGSDFLGRDVLARLLWGGRWMLGMGGLALAVAVGLGLPLGIAAGSIGGRLDAALMRLVARTEAERGRGDLQATVDAVRDAVSTWRNMRGDS